MKNFELFMGCLGNGITVCNKAIEEHGDYKIIAHIAECGKVKWYVKPDSIPGDALLKIEHAASVQSEKWENWLSSMPEGAQYEYLLDRASHEMFMRVIKMNGNIIDKIQYLKNTLYQNSRL